MSGDSVLNELIAAKENIKRKYYALKNGEADIQSNVLKTLKPIIEPLNKIREQTEDRNIKNVEHINNDYDDDDKYKNSSTEDYIKDTDSESQLDVTIESPYDIWFKSKDLDKIYGPKKIYRNTIILGKEIIKFSDKKTILIRSKKAEFPLTDGLLQLIFLKSPFQYSNQDLETYKSILVKTSAHLTADRSKMKQVGHKYSKIISKLFQLGSGLHMKLQKNNLVYWDDPNELVDRLRLLLASKSAGNTGVQNEILSIYEELHEAGIIRRIPDV